MPYENEYAHKTSHMDFVKNPEVLAFLDNCEYLTVPSDEEAQQMAAYFLPPARDESQPLPEMALAIDGSPYESSKDDRLPSTKIGYLKVGAILFSLEHFNSLRNGRFVDPFRVATLQDNNTTLSFVLPSANVKLKGKANVRDSFRAALDAQFLNKATRFDDKNHHTSLRSTLFHLAYRRPGELKSRDPFHLKIHACPTCKDGPVEVEDKEDAQFCPYCGAEVYPTDCLRLWEEVSDYQSNYTALSRLMTVLEHLLPIHYIRFVADRALFTLTRIAFFLDGPLAIYGPSAWLHRSIMIYLHEVNAKLMRQQQPPLLIIGLQKTGQIVDHVNLIDRYVPPDRLFCIDDDYRYKFILANRDPSANGFGFETYYGQDFIFKTRNGRTFVFALPYPYASKDAPGGDFIKEKVDWRRYPMLPVAVRLIEHLESDLYRNAVVPIALAHRYTAISLQPGGRVLDLLTKRVLV
jgi:rubrerythrin